MNNSVVESTNSCETNEFEHHCHDGVVSSYITNEVAIDNDDNDVEPNVPFIATNLVSSIDATTDLIEVGNTRNNFKSYVLLDSNVGSQEAYCNCNELIHFNSRQISSNLLIYILQLIMFFSRFSTKLSL